ncbi:hypothetical protein JTB14_002261 [Gonioctena quinquepunctata]|nr:hypothetical protein JTB14_002261 [Gonioctena quinquepunctata]
MCTSLSAKNYVSPLESAEYKQMSSPLPPNKLEHEKNIIEEKYPGIFDIDTNVLEIEYLQDEINLVQEEGDNLDEVIRIIQILENDLLKEFDKNISLEIKSKLQLKTTQDELLKYGRNLHDFEFGPVPNFINNMDIKVYQDKVENMTSMLLPVLEENPVSINLTVASNSTCLDITNINEAVVHDLYKMRHRILHSHKKFLATKIEVEKLKEMYSYLNKVTVEYLLAPIDSLYLQQNIESKKDSKQMMCSMLDGIATEFADQQISSTQLKYVEKELDSFQTRLNNITSIEDSIKKLLSRYLVLSILYMQEKEDIDGSDKFFRKVIHYISKDLESCIARTGKMNQIITEYNNNSPEERYTLIRCIIKMLSSNEENFSISRAFEMIRDFKREIGDLENKLFSFKFSDYRSTAADLKGSINILQQFLLCGPTYRVVLVPSELHFTIKEIEDTLKKQLVSVKTAVDISSSMKRIPNKWQNYRRQLWMYFYAEPHRLKFILKQVEEEFAKSKVGN